MIIAGALLVAGGLVALAVIGAVIGWPFTAGAALLALAVLAVAAGDH